MRARLSMVAVIGVGLWAIGIAQAEAQTAPTPAELAEARRQFELGVSEYQRGDLEGAVLRFTRAHELSEAPELLYNIATAHERLRHDREALSAYEAYLRAVPGSEDREAIETRVRMLRETAAPTAPTRDVATPEASSVALDPVRDVAPPSQIDDGERGDDATGWALTMTTGIVLAVGGGVLLGISALDLETAMHSTSWADASDARDRAPILSGAGIAALGLGALATIGGIVWGVVQADRSPVRVAVGAGSLTLAGSF